MQALVPKNRKPKFNLTLRVIDLANIPLACGTASVKWHLPSSISAEHRGRTEKADVREHKASWDYVKELSVRLTVDKNRVLQECEIHFEVLQEYHESGKGRVHLGNVKLNLAEYVGHPGSDAGSRGRGRDGRTGHHATDEDSRNYDPADDDDNDDDDEDEGGIVRRYLLQDSKINSTLRIGIDMKQTEGDSNFIAPPLKSAMVFGGIAGLVASEAVGEGDEIPTITSKTRELSELQDVYRRNLAATWACMAGELAPDKLIEDLFAGGDGGRMNPPQTPSSSSSTTHHRHHHHHHHHHHHQHQLGSGSVSSNSTTTTKHSRDESAGSSTSDSESRHTVTPRHLSPRLLNGQNDSGSNGGTGTTRPSLQHRRFGSRSQDLPGTNSGSSSPLGPAAAVGISSGPPGPPPPPPPASSSRSGTVGGRASIAQQMQHSPVGRRTAGNYREVTEFEIRKDLRSWQIKAK